MQQERVHDDGEEERGQDCPLPDADGLGEEAPVQVGPGADPGGGGAVQGLDAEEDAGAHAVTLRVQKVAELLEQHIPRHEVKGARKVQRSDIGREAVGGVGAEVVAADVDPRGEGEQGFLAAKAVSKPVLQWVHAIGEGGGGQRVQDAVLKETRDEGRHRDGAIESRVFSF